MNFPGAGVPTWMRSGVTRSPVSKWNAAHGFGMRSNFIFWIGWPVALFMMVATILMSAP